MSTPNADQVRYWNEVAAPTWVERQEMLDALIDGLGQQALDRARPAPGERVLDVGCGCGATSLALGRRVGPTGEVLGVDVSRPMLGRARERIGAAGAANVRFLEADAQTADVGRASFDLAFSRFGVMFFAEPDVAFANLRASLRPGGRLTFVCWQRVDRNPWMLVPVMATAKHVPLPPPDPLAPGPFAFADPERVRGILDRAGFRDVVLEEGSDQLALGGGDVDRASEFALEMGPAAAALREAVADAALRERVTASIREALLPFAPGGALRLPAATWIVTAARGED
jgi:SAM-dependent methyltransferase